MEPKEDVPEIEITPEMIEAAEKAMWAHAMRFNIVSIDEMHAETFRLMIAAAISQMRATQTI